jgi:hypothetical protein
MLNNNLSLLVNSTNENGKYTINTIIDTAKVKKEKKENVNDKIKKLNSEVSNDTMEILDAVMENQLYANFKLVNDSFYDMLSSYDTTLALQLKNTKDLKEYYSIVNGYISNLSNNNVNEISLYEIKDKQENKAMIEKYGNEKIALYQFNMVEKLLIFQTAYFKAVFNKNNMSFSNVKYIDNNGNKIYIDYLKNENLIGKKYAYTNSTNVENFPTINGKYKEIIDKIISVPFIDRCNTNTYNECLVRTLEEYKKLENKGFIGLINKKENQYSKLSMNLLHFADVEEKLIQYRKLIVGITVKCVDGIIKAHFEGLKGSKKRNEINNNFVSLYDDFQTNKNGDKQQYIDLIQDNTEYFKNIVLDLNLKKLLTKEQAIIFYYLLNGMPQRDIMTKLNIANRKITAVKKIVQDAYYNSMENKKRFSIIVRKYHHSKTIEYKNYNKEKLAILLRIRKMVDRKFFIDNITIENNLNYKNANVIDSYIEKPNTVSIKNQYCYLSDLKKYVPENLQKYYKCNMANYMVWYDFIGINNIYDIPFSMASKFDYTEYNEYMLGNKDSYTITLKKFTKSSYAEKSTNTHYKYFENSIPNSLLEYYASRIHCN